MQQRKNLILIAELCAVALIVVVVRFGASNHVIGAAFAQDKALMAHPEIRIAWVGWIIFTLYWEIAKKKATAATSSESAASRGVHVLMTNLGLLLVAAPLVGLGRYMPILPSVMWIGLAVEAIGLFIAIWARIHLGRNWSGEITIKVDHQLIRSGPYKLLRHPIYTGILAMYLGTAVVTGEWLAVIGVVLVVFAYWRKIRLEEANMVVAFGADYDAYRRESWALVPGLY